MTISIVGTGYVGLTTGALLAAAGHKVYCIDVDKEKIKTIKGGKSYFYEKGLDHFVKKGIESGNLIPTLSYEEAIPESEVAMICVGTPPNPDGSSDLTYIFQSAKSIAENMNNNLIIVQKSTVPVGTGRRIEKLVDKASKGKSFSVVSCPEFLAEGSAVLDTFNIDRLVVGSDSQEAKDKIIKLFESLNEYSKEVDLSKLGEYATIYKEKADIFNKIPFEDRVLSTSLESAELIKVTANSMLASKISFANSIARLCDKVDADINDVMDGVGMDHRIERAFLYAGLGWGGGCFPKDVSGLIYFGDEKGVDLKILKSVVDTNSTQIPYAIRLIQKMIGDDLENKTITIFGLTFKPGTSDVRISPAIHLVNNLLRYDAKIKVYDHEGMENAKKDVNGRVYYAKDPEDAVKDSDVAVLATDWPQLVDLDFKELKPLFKTPNLLDARNKWPREEVEKLGYKYQGIGR